MRNYTDIYRAVYTYSVYMIYERKIDDIQCISIYDLKNRSFPVLITLQKRTNLL